MPAIVHVFREEDSNTGQLVVACPTTKKCAIIDPVLDYNAASGAVKADSADKLLQYCSDQGFTVEWSLDTHIHADHLSATDYIKQKTGASKAIGANVLQVQEHMKNRFNLPQSFIEGQFWDKLWKDGDKFNIGELEVHVMHTPGHTPADLSYYIPNDVVITGDSLFMPDMGTARCDFPGGSVEALWESTHKILSLPGETRVFVGHDYMPDGREWSVHTTVALELKENKHVKEGSSKEDFIKFRKERDASLATPRLYYASMHFNIRGGVPPPPEEGSDEAFVKIPISICYK